MKRKMTDNQRKAMFSKMNQGYSKLSAKFMATRNKSLIPPISSFKPFKPLTTTEIIAMRHKNPQKTIDELMMKGENKSILGESDYSFIQDNRKKQPQIVIGLLKDKIQENRKPFIEDSISQ